MSCWNFQGEPNHFPILIILANFVFGNKIADFNIIWNEYSRAVVQTI